MTADAKMAVGVVIERRRIDNPWCDFDWRPVAAFAPAAAVDAWRPLAQGEDWVQFHAATLPLELFRGETDGYRDNLGQPSPLLYVVLRPGEDAEEMEVEPFHVTACPYEAMGYHESGDEIVEGVTMPPEIAAWLAAFVDRHHQEAPFRKRRNKRHRDDRQGSRPRGRYSRGAP